METILVTGATGNVGSHVVHELRARAASVRALGARPCAGPPTTLGDVELAVGDFDDRESLRRALAGVSRVFLTSADGPDKVAHETALIDAAAELGVDLVVKLSAMHATVHPSSRRSAGTAGSRPTSGGAACPPWCSSRRSS